MQRLSERDWFSIKLKNVKVSANRMIELNDKCDQPDKPWEPRFLHAWIFKCLPRSWYKKLKRRRCMKAISTLNYRSQSCRCMCSSCLCNHGACVAEQYLTSSAWRTLKKRVNQTGIFMQEGPSSFPCFMVDEMVLGRTIFSLLCLALQPNNIWGIPTKSAMIKVKYSTCFTVLQHSVEGCSMYELCDNF